MNKPSLPWKKKKEICDSTITCPEVYYRENINIFNEKLNIGFFSL